MSNLRQFLFAFAFACAAAMAHAQGDEAAIRAAVESQAGAWNHGDIAGFMQAYEDSPETTFVGASVHKGYDTNLKRYQANYATAAQMGSLSFSSLEVRLLPSSCGAPEYAIVTGSFHLQRTEHGAAAKDDGVFSLLWHKGPQGWKIVLDHTS